MVPVCSLSLSLPRSQTQTSSFEGPFDRRRCRSPKRTTYFRWSHIVKSSVNDQAQFLISKFVALVLPIPNLSTLGFIAKRMETTCLTAKVVCRVGLELESGFERRQWHHGVVFYNITNYNIHAFLSAQNCFKALLVSNFDSIEFSSPKLYSQSAVRFFVQCQVSSSASFTQEGNPREITAN